MSKAKTSAPVKESSILRTTAASGNTATVNGDTASKARVIDATVACILELGFYRASTNEIARRAGVTWGVIQHYFGTREALMLAVLQKGADEFVDSVERTHIDGDTIIERIEQLVDVFSAHYARPDYVANLQILLNMDRDPRTGGEIRKTMLEVAERSNIHVRRLMREALGPASRVPDLSTTIFLVLRGFGLNQQLLGTMSYDAVAPKKDRLAHQRQLLVEMITLLIEQLSPQED